MESLEDAVDAGIPSTDEAVVLKEKKKKKKNRQMLEIQDRVDKDQEQEFGEPITTCLSVSHERSDPELKKIRKRSRSDTKSLRAMESLESAANAGLSSTDEAVVLKKKKKKKKREMLEIQHRVDKDLEQEFAEPNTTCLSVSHERSEPEVKRKRKRLGSDTELLKAVESIESAVDAGLPSTDEAAVLKKKKKKKKSKD
ncbi:trichohyalin-like isoform X2 [Xyrichtys novacula]|uniref:Trichohyalin-like isoform X2 n=1 Tax=Xyrichtys novacula TaxID=13765 RepID=A0AAV1FT52_XYRNO|nr:trichohyalin-like isoform X2 [Xyrichtys novacula]